MAYLALPRPIVNKPDPGEDYFVFDPTDHYLLTADQRSVFDAWAESLLGEPLATALVSEIRLRGEGLVEFVRHDDTPEFEGHVLRFQCRTPPPHWNAVKRLRGVSP